MYCVGILLYNDSGSSVSMEFSCHQSEVDIYSSTVYAFGRLYASNNPDPQHLS